MEQDRREDVPGKARRERKAWMSDTWKHVEERHALKLTVANMSNKKNHKAKRSYKRDMRRIDEIAHKAEVAAEQREVKKVYDLCRIWRDIVLLSVASIVLSEIIQEGMKDSLEGTRRMLQGEILL